MLIYLIILFTVTPIVELAILINIGRYIGLWYTLVIVVLTGVFGAILARTQGLATLYKIQDNINKGIMPSDEILNGIIILCGGILFLTPGLITDLAGFIMLIPFTRCLLKKWLHRKIQRMIDKGKVITIN